ncbi:MAG: SF1B family DNA helicase RecD2 [Anaerolineae bacterium]
MAPIPTLLPGGAVDTVEGIVERVTYYSAASGYSVLRLKPSLPASSDNLITVVGALPEVKPGEHLRLQGEWTTHPEFGRQFRASRCERDLPTNQEGIRRYLGSGLIKGIGPRTADKIVALFGSQSLEIIEHTPDRLLEVPDIGGKRLQLIIEAWRANKAISEVMVFLQQYGISTNLAIKIYKTYGDGSLGVVRENPYRLIHDIWGIGFKTADKIAQALGLPADAPSRLAAGITHLLNEASDDGHVYMPESALLASAVELLQATLDQVRSACNDLLTANKLASETLGTASEPAIYLDTYHQAEKETAWRLHTLLNERRSLLADLAQIILFRQDDGAASQLSDEQTAALRLALQHKVCILTGGPGTGKTTALRALIEMLERNKHPYALASPTGRAAKRLSEATGRPAQTVHRLLGYTPASGFNTNESYPLRADLIVVDEASMLDLQLTQHLLAAIEPGAHLLLVGDVDQLPSVGAGDVLRDLVRSKRVPVARLTHIYRQEAGSQIIANAHRINQGQAPEWSQPAADMFLFTQADPQAASDLVVDIVSQRVPAKFGVEPQDIQVLAPMHRGLAGVSNLNIRLQESLNPPLQHKAEHTFGGRILRVGDRVMQIHNNYSKEVFNGDIGRISEIDLENQSLTVTFDGKPVQYDWSEVDELLHAFAISVHKSQGSEFPVVVLPILTQHYVMLQRNLLYTAITRAKKLCVLVGTRQAIAMAVRNNKTQHRWSGLADRLPDLPLVSG